MILACRDMTKARMAADAIRQQSGNGNVVVKKLDLASLQSVRDLAKDIHENEERLDILINNAGMEQQWGQNISHTVESQKISHNISMVSRQCTFSDHSFNWLLSRIK